MRTYEEQKKKAAEQKQPTTVYDAQVKRLHQKIEENITKIFQELDKKKPVPEIVPKPLPSAAGEIPIPVRQSLKTAQPVPAAPTQQRPPLEAPPAPQPRPADPLLSVPIPQPVSKDPPPAAPRPQIPLPAEFSSQKFKRLSVREKTRFIKDIALKQEELEDFIKMQKTKAKIKTVIKKEDYTIYKPNEWGAVANKHMKKYADQLIKKYPQVFNPLFDQFQRVDVPILSHSYVSLMLFFTIVALPTLLISFIVLNFIFRFSILLVVLFACIATLLTLIGFYLYPSSLLGDRRKKIKKDIPFALVHMSAVAGSGANPISIFELLVESEEYAELKKEIRKILNYVNLFGYNLSTALRNVAGTTASEELKELLNGMVSTIETGGDLKGYLKGKADDALVTYRLDRQKEVESIATFSEIYTAILIAAPLLMLVTLSIINTIGGEIGGISVKILAQGGILVALPLMNVGYMFFIKAQSANL